jgi:hypothetical protein
MRYPKQSSQNAHISPLCHACYTEYIFISGLNAASSVALQQWCHSLHVSSPTVQIVSVLIPSHPPSFYDTSIGWSTLGFTIASESHFRFMSRDSLFFSTEWSVEYLLILSTCMLIPVKTASSFHTLYIFNPLNAKLNSIYHLLALLGANHIFHISKVRVRHLLVVVHSKFSAFPAYPNFQNQVVGSSGNACDLFHCQLEHSLSCMNFCKFL